MLQVGYYSALHEDHVKNFESFSYDYFEDLLAPITFAKNFGVLAGVVFKIIAIKNELATNCNVNQFHCNVLM